MRVSSIPALAIALSASACLMNSAMAQAPIQIELLTPYAEFTDDVDIQIRTKFEGGGRREVLNVRDPTHMVVAKITLQPQAIIPWHTHHGPVLVTVVEGDWYYIHADDCVYRDYSAGTAFVDQGDHVHTTYNPSATEETVLIATYFNVPAGAPLTIRMPAPDSCPTPTP